MGKYIVLIDRLMTGSLGDVEAYGPFYDREEAESFAEAELTEAADNDRQITVEVEVLIQH